MYYKNPAIFYNRAINILYAYQKCIKEVESINSIDKEDICRMAYIKLLLKDQFNTTESIPEMIKDVAINDQKYSWEKGAFTYRKLFENLLVEPYEKALANDNKLTADDYQNDPKVNLANSYLQDFQYNEIFDSSYLQKIDPITHKAVEINTKPLKLAYNTENSKHFDPADDLKSETIKSGMACAYDEVRKYEFLHFKELRVDYADPRKVIIALAYIRFENAMKTLFFDKVDKSYSLIPIDLDDDVTVDGINALIDERK